MQNGTILSTAQVLYDRILEENYKVPAHEVVFWLQNGWKYSDCGNYLIRKKQQVEIQKNILI